MNTHIHARTEDEAVVGVGCVVGAGEEGCGCVVYCGC